MTLTAVFRKTTDWWRGEARSTKLESRPPGPGCSITESGWGTESVDRHYCRILAGSGESTSGEEAIVSAWKVLEKSMALVPAGEVSVVPNAWPVPDVGVGRIDPIRVRVGAIYVDRYTVTNDDFAGFVAAGGYRHPEFWPAQILPQVLLFVDQTGIPGPRFWSQGEPPRNKLDHPVTGICWYEAQAFASWVGKRLPTSPEWQRAACWSDGQGVERRYPWGNAFAPDRANTWIGGPGDTVPVGLYYDGCTPNGIYQLTGNVWEWSGTVFDFGRDNPDCEVVSRGFMAEVRGGAFDTYFETQATCQFRSGHALFDRAANLGFRCCVSADSLRSPRTPCFLESEVFADERSEQDRRTAIVELAVYGGWRR